MPIAKFYQSATADFVAVSGPCYAFPVMRRSRIKNWQRIGIVISVIWGTAAPILCWQSADALIRETETYYYDCVFEPDPNQSRCEDQQYALVEATWRVASEQAVWVLLPIALIGLLLWIVSSGMRGIKHVFLRPRPTTAAQHQRTRGPADEESRSHLEEA